MLCLPERTSCSFLSAKTILLVVSMPKKVSLSSISWRQNVKNLSAT